MKIWNRLLNALSGWWRRSGQSETKTPIERGDSGPEDLDLARESLRTLVEDTRVPKEVRHSLAEDYRQVGTMLEKLENEHIHIAAFGRVSVGKSATLNALLGEDRFSTSPLHGETRRSDMGRWQERRSDNVFLIDTPGINEVAGEGREQLARDVAGRSDLVIFLVDGDLTHSELEALQLLAKLNRPLLLVLNKADRYSEEERETLLSRLRQHAEGMVKSEDVIAIAADPAVQRLIHVDSEGREREQQRKPAADVAALRERLWTILEREGKTLAALNATLFAGDLSTQVGERTLTVKRSLGRKVIHTYCTVKGVAVALNPIPVADLATAAIVDASMVIHLSRLFGLPLSRAEAGQLIKTIMSQMVILMGAVWAIHLVSSALKLGTGGISTLATGSAQGAVAYFSTLVVGEAAEQYLAQGKSWGEGGPKQVVQEILDRLDRNSVLAEAKASISARIRSESV